MFKDNLRKDRGITRHHTFCGVLDLVNNPGAGGICVMRYFKLCVSTNSTSYIFSLRREASRTNVLPSGLLFGFLFITTIGAIKHNKHSDTRPLRGQNLNRCAGFGLYGGR